MYKGIAHQVLLGSLLGDGSVEKSKTNTHPRYVEGHSLKQKDYLLMKKELLPFETNTTFGESKPHKIRNEFIKGTKYINIRSRQFKKLHCYRNPFYPDGKKVVTREILDQLDVFGLLIWHLDDGTYNYCNNSVLLATMGFTQQENQIIQQYFEERWKLKTTTQNTPHNKFAIRFDKKSTKKLMKLFVEYKELIPQNMYYKLGLDKKKEKEQKQKAVEYRKNKWKNNSEYREGCLKKSHQYHKENKVRLNKQSKEYYLKNRERLDQKNKERFKKKYDTDLGFRERVLKGVRERRREAIKDPKYRDKINKRKREDYQKHKEANRRKAREYYWKNREEINKKQRERYKKNCTKLGFREKQRKYHTKWRGNHKEEVNKKRRRYWHKNKEHLNKKQRERYRRLKGGCRTSQNWFG